MTEPTNGPLVGLRVLVVEDSFLIATSLRDMVAGFGCQVVGPVSTVAAAQRLLGDDKCDAALLDIDLGGETSEPVAATMVEQHRPFLFVTGYSSPGMLSAGFKQFRRLRKPLTEVTLKRAMVEEFVKH
jgi:CheY-like chemotaxis protein